MMLRRRLMTTIAPFLLAFFALLSAAATAQAGPAAPGEIVITQPDGTTLTARAWGDEWQHGLETIDGYTLLQDEASGYWVYARRQDDGSLSPALSGGKPLRAGIDAPGSLPLHARPDPLRPGTRPIDPGDLPRERLLLNDGLSTGMHKTGEQKLLVILVEFNDQSHQFPASAFQQAAFGATNSIKHYFTQASNGLLTYVPAAESDDTESAINDGVVGWLDLERPHPGNTTVITSRSLAIDAIKKADPHVKFNLFDEDNNGYVTADELHILIIAAGCEESQPCGEGIHKVWAHSFELDNGMLEVDGVYIAQDAPTGGKHGGYAAVGERHWDGKAYYPAPFGIMAHELGHLFGWPDLYDTCNTSNGVGDWSIMGSGNWNAAGGKPGSSPALPDPFLKWYKGWINPVPAQTPHSSIYMASTSPDGYIIGSNPGGVDWVFQQNSGQGEYWLVENRRKTGYDAGLPGQGLLLWHIDETAPYNNTANCLVDANYHPKPPLVALEQADGLDDLRYGYNKGDAGDPYPGSWLREFWGPDTNPSSAYNSGSPSGFSMKVMSSVIRVYLPAVTNQFPVAGVLTSGGSPAPGQRVALCYTTDNWKNYKEYAATTTGADGSFTMPMPPLLSPQHQFQIVWRNTQGNDAWLSSFYSNTATQETARRSYALDIANVRLIYPPPGWQGSLPVTFQWARRSSGSDTYRIVLADETGQNIASSAIGYTTGSAVINALPGWVKPGMKIYWFVEVNTPDGYGYSYWMNPITFNGLAAAPPGPAAAASPGAFSDTAPAARPGAALPAPAPEE